MLQVQQSGYQPGRQGGPSTPRGEVPCKVVFDQLPLHQSCQSDQRVAHVEQFVQAGTEHLGSLCGAGVGLHGLQYLQEMTPQDIRFLQISHHVFVKFLNRINCL